MNKQKVMQYNVLVPNQPGALAKVTRLLAQDGINVSGLMSISLGANSCLQFVAERENGLREALEGAGFKVVAHKGLQLEVANRPGELHRVIKTLAEKEINILSLYGTADGARSAKFILNVDRPEEAAQALAREGFDRDARREDDEVYTGR